MLESFYPIIGQIVVYLFAILLVATVVIAILIAHSFKTGFFPFPNLMLSGILVLEGFVKAFFRLLNVDDSIADNVIVQLKNKISLKQFENLPFDKKAIFLPQCLRSTNCPAKLSPEGIQCINCGQCDIGGTKKILEEMGYMVFIVPGSSFIKRMIKEYKPEAILGVGCIPEVKGGLELCHRFGVPAIGILLDRDGCVSTTLNWDTFCDATKADLMRRPRS
ncbi:MAG: DUF116 domain-containing protein [Methanocellales archaeon]|nr:DUF116 domain-containing protein [Methanocellales archaeon]